MPVMTEAEFEKGVTIKTASLVQRALNRVVAEVKCSPRVRWRDGEPTKEAVVNAVWLWLGDLDPDFIEDVMSVYVPRLEALLRGDDPPALPEQSPPPDPIDGPIPRAPRRRGAG